MSKTTQSQTALILIDIQKGLDEPGFYGSERNNPQAEDNCKQLLDFFRKNNLTVYHVQHMSDNPDSPLYPGKTGNDIKLEVAPIEEEKIFQKNVNSAFIGTELEQTLKAASISQVIIVGLTTEHCVSTSVRMAANLGFETTLVSDATATFDKTGIFGEHYSADTMHLAHLASLNGEFARVIDTNTLIQELQTCSMSQ